MQPQPSPESVERPLVRHGQAPAKLSREAFGARFRESFADPAFEQAADAVARLEEIAWQAYHEGRKAPVTRRAGDGFADPDYELSVDWLRARERIEAAAVRQRDAATRSRALLIVGAARNDGTCPGEMSKSFRLATLAAGVLDAEGVETDLLDLSLLTSDYGRRIHPCKGCASTAMPLCHWPCSCYPNHASDQVGDWMNEIYERWTAAHGVMIVTPVYWWQAPSPLKLMIDRMVCADGGNVDPTSTHGKKADEAKEMELRGWHYPRHLAGRAYSVVAHGDVAGAGDVRRALCDWLEWTGHVPAATPAKLDRYIGYWEPYATSHDALDADEGLQGEVRNAARALAAAIDGVRAGRLRAPDDSLRSPRQK